MNVEIFAFEEYTTIDQRIIFPFVENNCNLCGIKIVNWSYLQTPDTNMNHVSLGFKKCIKC